MRDTPIIQALSADIPAMLDGIGIAKVAKGRRYPKDHQTGEKIKYLDLISSFDIETSKRKIGFNRSDWEGWMYHWQWQLGDIATIVGRTWPEFLVFTVNLGEYLKARGCRLLCWVHNLAFEFQYLSGIWHFNEEDVFATEERRVLYCKLGPVEMRCSARLSGYSLDTWGKELKVDHQKLAGDLDYNVIRYPWTPLTKEELAYCVHDVMCVVECVTVMLHSYGDTLYSIPYTATGYIRRRVRTAMKYWSGSGIRAMQNPLYVYDRLRQAFRGGDTHANRYCVDVLLSDVESYDRSSSYPDVMCHCKFPMTAFKEEEPTLDAVAAAAEAGRAILMKIGFVNIRLKVHHTGDPYLSTSICEQRGFMRPQWNKDRHGNPVLPDNGRILEAAYCECALTDLDFEIIDAQYTWDAYQIEWAMSARYGFLPQPLIDVIIGLYHDKTALKGVEGRELQYLHSKQEINSCYGMMCQHVISVPIVFKDGKWKPADVNREVEYNKAIDKAFLNYAWAVWVTAWARYRLHEGIALATVNDPLDFVYADTDSVKCRSRPDFTKWNAERIRDAKSSGAWALDPKGNPHYMGVFEYEGRYDWFKTLGAKRYCTMEDGKLTITVAGVPKSAGSKNLDLAGGIEQFTDTYVFSDIGKLTAFYNDEADYMVEIEGHQLPITRFIVLVETDYRMELETDYAAIVQACKEELDKAKHPDL